MQSRNNEGYSRLPDNSIFKRKSKKVRNSGISSYQEYEANNWKGVNASNKHTSKLDKYTVLGTVFKLDRQKSNDKEYMVVKIDGFHSDVKKARF